jgi:hypothetical protein
LQPKIADGCPVRDYCPRDALASPPGTAEFRDECLKFLGVLLDGNFFAKFLHFFPFEFRLSNFCWARRFGKGRLFLSHSVDAVVLDSPTCASKRFQIVWANC